MNQTTIHPYFQTLVTKQIVGAPTLLLTGHVKLQTKYTDEQLNMFLELFQEEHPTWQILSIAPLLLKDNRVHNKSFKKLVETMFIFHVMINGELKLKTATVEDFVVMKKKKQIATSHDKQFNDIEIICCSN